MVSAAREAENQEKEWIDHRHSKGIRFRIRGLPHGDSPVCLKFDASELDFAAFSDSASIEGIVHREGDRLDLNAIVSAEGAFECTRCAEPFRSVISAPLKLHFVPENLGQPAGDPDVQTYDPVGTSELDLLPDVRDALILAIPMKHLCRSNCKGLCPTCGKNRNLESCNCSETGEEIGALAALKGLRERLRAEENPVRNN